MNIANRAGLAAACVAGMVGAAPSNAALVSLSDTFTTETVVNGTTATILFNFAATGAVTDVNIFIDFIKCQGALTPPLSVLNDCGANNGAANAHEISFKLISPLGPAVDLVVEDTTYFPG